jgi:hypothetical protein
MSVQSELTNIFQRLAGGQIVRSQALTEYFNLFPGIDPFSEDIEGKFDKAFESYMATQLQDPNQFDMLPLPHPLPLEDPTQFDVPQPTTSPPPIVPMPQQGLTPPPNLTSEEEEFILSQFAHEQPTPSVSGSVPPTSTPIPTYTLPGDDKELFRIRKNLEESGDEKKLYIEGLGTIDISRGETVDRDDDVDRLERKIGDISKGDDPDLSFQADLKGMDGNAIAKSILLGTDKADSSAEGGEQFLSENPEVFAALWAESLGLPVHGRSPFQKWLADKWRGPYAEYNLRSQQLMGGFGGGATPFGDLEENIPTFQQYIGGREGPAWQMQPGFLDALTQLSYDDQEAIFAGLGDRSGVTQQQVFQRGLQNQFPSWLAANLTAQAFGAPSTGAFEISPQRMAVQDPLPFLNYLRQQDRYRF